MTGQERTLEDAEEDAEAEKRGGPTERGSFHAGTGTTIGIPTDIYGEPIFSFDYLTRANASRLSRRLHLTVDRGSKIFETEKKRDGNPKSLVTTA